MAEDAALFQRRYTKALWSFVAHGSEDLRELALGLGREALAQGLGILDVALLQKEAAAGLEPGPAQDRAADFFTEALAAYEMRLRGAQEAYENARNQNLALEQRVAERTRSLQDKEEQLRHAQKLDAMGRLAGGVAHDFNNLLTIVLGYAQLCEEGLTAGDTDAQRESLALIRKAAERGAELTRHLLAFSRKGPIEPTFLDLNAEVADAVKLLGRVVGEAVRLSFKPAPTPCPVHVDRGHLQQLILNLVLNARDALPQGGSIQLHTAHALLSEAHLAGHPESRPGAYGMFTVSDNGVGMDTATQARLFEPFFTTKADGKGTGLGLATVYGIVTQNHGLITFNSQPGQGTTFKVYLPAEAPHA